MLKFKTAKCIHWRYAVLTCQLKPNKVKTAKQPGSYLEKNSCSGYSIIHQPSFWSIKQAKCSYHNITVEANAFCSLPVQIPMYLNLCGHFFDYDVNFSRLKKVTKTHLIKSLQEKVDWWWHLRHGTHYHIGAIKTKCLKSYSLPKCIKKPGVNHGGVVIGERPLAHHTWSTVETFGVQPPVFWLCFSSHWLIICCHLF